VGEFPGDLSGFVKPERLTSIIEGDTMAAKSILDVYANMAIATVLESAANTLTFKKIETGISFDRQVAWIINRLEYNAGSLLAANFNGDGDALEMGLAIASSWTAVSLNELAIIDYMSIQRADFGAAASSYQLRQPFQKDFSSLPGGGLILAPAPLYFWAKGTGLVAATNDAVRIYYTLLELDGAAALELFQARRAIIS
jgi:hypothetical protein